MALKGNLETFRLEEILQLIASQRKTGVLKLNRGDVRFALVFEEGRVISTHEPLSREPSGLELNLERMGKLAGAALSRVSEIRRSEGADPLDVILSTGAMPPEELARFLEEDIQDELLRALSWRSGNYEFINRAPGPNSNGFRLAFRTEGILMEAMRRLDEMNRFRRALSSKSAMISRQDLSLAREQDPRKRRILESVGTPRTLGDLEDSLPLWLFELYEGIYELWEAGILEVQGADEQKSSRDMQKRLASSPVEQVAFGAGAAVAMVGVALLIRFLTAGFLAASGPLPPSTWDEARAEQYVDDVRLQAEVYRTRHGSYPISMPRVAGWSKAPQGAKSAADPAALASMLSDSSP
jgi:hypothetical protein